MRCRECHGNYPIVEGLAFLAPEQRQAPVANKYELDEVVSSYLWSHYGDLLDDEEALDAYLQWASRITPHSGIALDLGGAVGRFTFEMSSKCDLAVGVDNSVAFIKTARELMNKRELTFLLKEEGLLGREVTIYLPEAWHSKKVEFIVGDAQRLPFRSGAVASVSSLNLIDKVPHPQHHLEEMNRVVARTQAQFFLSDPFSWSTEAAPAERWLGGKKSGPFAGRGLANIKTLLQEGSNGLAPCWQVEESGHVWWKIRTHCNHYELIKSCFVKALR